MHLNRDQSMAVQAVKDAGYDPVLAAVLTGNHRGLSMGIVSVTAVKGHERYNIRVGVNNKKNLTSILEIDSLKAIIDNRRRQDVTNIDLCVVKNINRKSVK